MQRKKLGVDLKTKGNVCLCVWLVWEGGWLSGLYGAAGALARMDGRDWCE